MRVTMLGNDYRYAYAAQPDSVSTALGYSYTYGAIDRAVQTLGAEDNGQSKWGFSLFNQGKTPKSDNWRFYQTQNTGKNPKQAADEVAQSNSGTKFGNAAQKIADLLDRGMNLATAIAGVKKSVVTEEDKETVDRAGKEIGFLAGLNESGAMLPIVIGGVAVTGLLIFAATRKKGRRR